MNRSGRGNLQGAPCHPVATSVATPVATPVGGSVADRAGRSQDRVAVSVAAGLAVANVDYAQPLLELIGHDFGMKSRDRRHHLHGHQNRIRSRPTADRPARGSGRRRRLIVGQMLLSDAGAGCCRASRPTGVALLAALAAVGALAVVPRCWSPTRQPGRPGDRAGPSARHQRCHVGILLGPYRIRDVGRHRRLAFGVRGVGRATVVMAALLCAKLPRPGAARTHPVPALIRSVFTLFAEVPCCGPVLFVLLIFPRSPPSPLRWRCRSARPRTPCRRPRIGLFGLAGALGALARPGPALSDRGRAQRTTGLGLATMLASWIRRPAVALAVGSGHRGARDRLRTAVGALRQPEPRLPGTPEAQSRLTAGYMVFYSIGSAVGAITQPSSTTRRLTGVCLLGGRHQPGRTRVLGGDRPPRTRSRTAVTARPTCIARRRFAMTHYRTFEIDAPRSSTGKPVIPSSPLVVAARIPASSFMYRELIERLADQFHLSRRLSRFRAQRSSGEHGVPYTFDRLTDVVEKFTDRLGLGKLRVVYAGFGGPVGFPAREPPARTRHVPRRAERQRLRGRFAGPVSGVRCVNCGTTRPSQPGEIAQGRDVGRGLEWNYTHGAVTSPNQPGQLAPAETLLARPATRTPWWTALRTTAPTRRSTPMAEYLRTHQPPTLAVWGERRQSSRIRRARVQERPRHLDLNLLDTGHFALEDHSEE